MRVTHCQCDCAVTEDSLQCENVTAIHHEVTGVGVAKYMRRLPYRQSETAFIQYQIKRFNGFRKEPAI